MKKLLKKTISIFKKVPLAVGHLVKDLSISASLVVLAYTLIDVSVISSWVIVGLSVLAILMSLITFKKNISIRKSILFLEAIDNKSDKEKEQIKRAIQSQKAGMKKLEAEDLIKDTLN